MRIAKFRYETALPILAGVLLLATCSNPQPPVGRWQGLYEDSGVMIVARLEIGADGQVRVSAPNAIADVGAMSQRERADLRARLEGGLAESWPHVPPLPLEFDGKAFHKPGGVAPQLEWDGKAKHMTLVFYSGSRPSVRVPLKAVSAFAEAD
jgi:hypothetical protein